MELFFGYINVPIEENYLHSYVQLEIVIIAIM